MTFRSGDKVWISMGSKTTTRFEAVVVKDAGGSQLLVKLDNAKASSPVPRELVIRVNDKQITNGPVVLSPEEEEYYRKRFERKTYTTSTCIPMSPRQAQDIERRLGLNAKKKEV